jgi:hypothetical protein
MTTSASPTCSVRQVARHRSHDRLQLLTAIAERLDHSRGRDLEDSIELARLWIEGRAPAGHAPLIRAAEKGAVYAASIGAWSTAADLLEVLLADPNLVDPVTVAGYAERAGEAADFDHDPDRCARHMTTAATIARSIDDHRLWGRTVLTSARSRFTLGPAAVGRWIDVAAPAPHADSGPPHALPVAVMAAGGEADLSTHGDLGIATAAQLHVTAVVPALDRPSQSLLRWTADDVTAEGSLGDLRLTIPRLFSEATVAVDEIADAWHRGAPRHEEGCAVRSGRPQSLVARRS